MTNTSCNNEALNDFTVYGSSGSGRKVRVENDNNTGSSNAISQVYVEGTSSGDPFVRHIVGTSHSYAFGIDNSDSDKWKHTYSSDATATPSSSDVIRSTDTSGIWRRPMTPLFEAYVGTLYTITASTTEAIELDTEVFDQGSNYNTGTYTYTCPVTGTYLFTLSLALSNIGSDNYSTVISFYHSGVSGSVGEDSFNPYDIVDEGNFIQFNISLIYYMSSGDAITPQIFSIVADTINGNGLTRFSGYLLG